MIYVLAAIGAVSVAVLMWRAFGPNGDALGSDPRQNTTRTAPVAPDDDPDFLRSIDQQQRGKRPDEDE